MIREFTAEQSQHCIECWTEHADSTPISVGEKCWQDTESGRADGLLCSTACVAQRKRRYRAARRLWDRL